MSNVVIWCLWFATLIMVWPNDPPDLDGSSSSAVVIFALVAAAVAIYFDFLK